MQQDEDQLLVLARQFVEAKVPYADDKYKDELAVGTREKIDETIRMELIAAMTPEQLESYTNLLEKDDVTDDQIVGFMNENGININEITQVALTKFRIAYLGA